MIQTVVKRDGRIVGFNEEKIVTAIRKAMLHTDKGEDMQLIRQITDHISFKGEPQMTVEAIQDAVELELMASSRKDVAQKYIAYRNQRSVARKAKTRDMFLEIINIKSNDITRENANMNADTPAGMMMKFSSETTKPFVDDYLLSEEVKEAVSNNYLHIHDKDYYPTKSLTCVQHPLDRILKYGFSAGHGESRPAKRIETASILGCISLETAQNEMHGGQSVPNFDYAMADGVKKTYAKEYYTWLAASMRLEAGIDDGQAAAIIARAKSEITEELRIANMDAYGKALLALKPEGISEEDLKKAHDFAVAEALKTTEKQTHQAMEALIHNLNTMNSRAGAQVPFSSVNYGTDTSEEARMVIRNLLTATEDGLGGGETPIFPVQIFKVKEGVNFNPGDPNYDLFQLALKTSAQRLFPNFSFIDAPFNLQYYRPGDYNTEVAYMGCRTRVMGNVYDPTKEVTCGRGNLSFTSINLPRLGIEAHGDIDKFFKSLDDMIDLVIRQLMHRFKIQCSKVVRNYPFLMGQGIWIDSEHLDMDDSVAEVLKHGTLSVGFIGLAETLKALTGKHHGESEASQKLGLEIIGHMRNRMDEESRKTGLNFTLLATPAEGLSGRFVRIDQKKYGKIPGVTDREYYTNSFHVPVYYPIKAYKKIQLEAPYHALTNAGHISYVELDGDTCKNLKAFESVIRYMKEQGIGYGSVNHPVDRDPVCGYTGVIDDICPRCGRKEGEPVSLAFLKELRKKYPNVPVYTDEEIMAGGIEHDWRRTQECGCSSK